MAISFNTSAPARHYSNNMYSAAGRAAAVAAAVPTTPVRPPTPKEVAKEPKPKPVEIVDEFPKIMHKPMTCCGMLEAHGFDERYQHGMEERWGMVVPDMRYPNSARIKERLEKVIAAQTENLAWLKNCALITLSSWQVDAINEAEALGFQRVFEFYNPNSGNQVFLYVNVLWKDRQAWRNSQFYKDTYYEEDDEEDE